MKIWVHRVAIAAAIFCGSASGAIAQSVLVDEMVSSDAADGIPDEFTHHSDGNLYGIAKWAPGRLASVYRVDPITKVTTIAGTVDYGAGDYTAGATLGYKLVETADGNLYGSFLKADGNSGIFRFIPTSGAAEIIKTFPIDPDTYLGATPDGSLVSRLHKGSDGWLYGTTVYAGSDDLSYSGTVFKIEPASATFVQIAHPVSADAFEMQGSMAEASPGVWFLTYWDYSGACGKLARLDTASGVVTPVFAFDSEVDGCVPDSLVAAGGSVYGTWESGPWYPSGEFDRGGIFRINPATNGLTVLKTFKVTDEVHFPVSDLEVGPDGKIYFGYMFTFDPYELEIQKGLARLDPVTNAITKIAELPLLAGWLADYESLTVGNDGIFYMGQYAPYRLYSIGVVDAVRVSPVLNGELNGVTTVSATLTTLGTPLAGRTVSFTLDGRPVGSAVTNASGVATLTNASLKKIPYGTYPNGIVASYAGDGPYPAASGSAALEVVRLGLMTGDGIVKDDDTKYDFQFLAKEKTNGFYGDLTLRVVDLDAKKKAKKRHQARTPDDLFVGGATSMVFSDDPTVQPGRRDRPQIDTVLFSGPGKWNGQKGYRFEAYAQDRGEPGRHRESMRVTIFDSNNQVVVSFDDELHRGNIQSVRLKH